MTLENSLKEKPCSGWPNGKKRLTKLDRFAVLGQNFNDNAPRLSLDFIHDLHGFDNADHGLLGDLLAGFDI